MNKVKFNLKNVYYAVLEADEDTPIWGKPVRIPGAVSLAMDPQGDQSDFYADGMMYYTSGTNNGYSGDLEIAIIPESFSIDVMGEAKNDDDILVERSGIEFKSFALMFQFDGDEKEIRHVMYNCKANRAKVEGKTNESSKEVQTDSIPITSIPLKHSGQVKAKTTENAKQEVVNNWFKEVYFKEIPGGEDAA